jgi:hypothetical protein
MTREHDTVAAADPGRVDRVGVRNTGRQERAVVQVYEPPQA